MLIMGEMNAGGDYGNYLYFLFNFSLNLKLL